jgi:hypothetical protein
MSGANLPGGMIGFLLAQPDLSPELMKGISFLRQIRAELDQLDAQNPKNAQALAKVLAEAMGVPQPMLLSDSPDK